MKILSIMLFILLISCKNQDYYGYIYDIDNKTPISNVIVNDFLNNKNTKTNQNGYFNLEKGSSSSKLVFKKENYITDTVNSIQIQNGERMVEKFKGEKIYLSRISSNFKDSIKNLNKIN